MTLATRCTTCGTVFRVVQDQLKVSEGWVRCGRCNEVFSALEGLFDLGRDNPPEWSPEPPAAVTTEHEIEPADRNEAHPAPIALPREARTTPAARVMERDRLEFPDAQFESSLFADDVEATGPGARVSAVLSTETSSMRRGASIEHEAQPHHASSAGLTPGQRAATPSRK